MTRPVAQGLGSPVVSLAGGDVGLFASDMHLGDHDRPTASLFFDALGVRWQQASHVFLLGDLFEAWVGDDQPDDVAQQARALFTTISNSGRALFVMRGNRDFLLGTGPGGERRNFCRDTGARLLDDPSVIALFGRRVVLAHGDAQCTSDHAYQALRTRVRASAWQQAFLALDLPDRLAQARAMRAASKSAQRDAGRDAGLADVDQETIDTLLRQADAEWMIHGHTHLPGDHAWCIDGRARRRFVLPDWDASRRRGGFLRVSASAVEAFLPGPA